ILAFSGLPTDGQILTGTTFTWKDLNYTVLVKSGYRQLLNNIAGVIRPSQTTTQIDSTFNEYAMGDEYLFTLSWRFTHRWRNFGIMIGFLVFNIAFVMFIVKVNKR
ncbi:ATP-binding cassette transporter snq2, partial [Coemansia sp. RSA 2523]